MSKFCEYNENGDIKTCIMCNRDDYSCKSTWGEVHGNLRKAIDNKLFKDCENMECSKCNNASICSSMILKNIAI